MQESQNVFSLFIDDRVQANMNHLKSQLLIAVIALVRKNSWNQTEAAKLLNVSQPRLSNLFKGHMEKFSIDALFKMLVRAGRNIEFGQGSEQVVIYLRGDQS